MVSAPPGYLDGLITLVSQRLRQVQVVERGENPDRVLLDLVARYGNYEVRISEILDASGRKYAYYVFQAGKIVVGFDNTPDPLALRLKFGREARRHWRERIPHCHLQNKTKTELTVEMTCQDFLDWLEANLPEGASPSGVIC